MSYYVFGIQTLALLVSIAGAIFHKQQGNRISSAIAALCWFPAYIWFGWFSGLMF